MPAKRSTGSKKPAKKTTRKQTKKSAQKPARKAVKKTVKKATTKATSKKKPAKKTGAAKATAKRKTTAAKKTTPKKSAAKRSSAKTSTKATSKPAKKTAKKPAKKAATKSAAKRPAKKLAKKTPKKPAKKAAKKATKKPASKSPAKKAAKKAVKKAAKDTAKVPARNSVKTTASVRPRFTEPLRRFSEYENVRALIEGQAERYGDRTFLIYEDDGREFSYAALDNQTTRVANLIQQLGAIQGSRVGVLMQNSPDFVFAFLGTIKGGFIVVPVNTDLPPEQLHFQLKDCGVNYLFADASFWPTLKEFADDLPGLDTVILDGRPTDGTTVAPSHHDAPEDPVNTRIIDFHGALEAASDEPITQSMPRWWDESAIVYTGQHLEEPRGAILQHRQYMTSGRWLSIWLGLGREDRFMSGLPMFHSNAQVVALFTPLITGGSVVLSREFNVNRFWKAVERYRVSVLSAVPTMLGILTDREMSEAAVLRPGKSAVWPAAHESPGALGDRSDVDAREAGLARAHDISTLRHVICGAAPLHAAVHRAFEKTFLVPVIEGYSMAETTCFATVNPNNGTRKIGSVGVAVGDKIAIESKHMPAPPLEDWQPQSFLRMSPAVFPTADVDEPGEICVWGENVLKEYHQRPQLNPRAFAGGWFHTGDVGRMDRDGFVYVEGHIGEEIMAAGRRLMPREIDEVLFNHDRVESVATVGIEHPRRGSLVTTWVMMKPGTFEGGPDNGRVPANDGQAFSARADLESWVAGKLPEGRRPTDFKFVSRLPKDCTGKTRVLELRRMAGTTPDDD
jgi:long-chain acyl-CoA synthetase